MNIDYVIRQILEYILGVPAGLIMDHIKFDDLGATDLDRIEIAVQVEERLGVNVPNKVANKMETVADLVSYVKRNIN